MGKESLSKLSFQHVSGAGDLSKINPKGKMLTEKSLSPGTMTKWLSGANAALQVGQLVVTADPSQCQHQ